MKKRITFSQLLHKDKLMMVVSLILAIIIWVLVVYDQGNTEERPISGVPVSVTLTPFASEDLKLRIVDGAEAVATVYVEGPRSVIAQLTKQDITVTADTSTVLTPGTYTVPIHATPSGKFDILRVVGDDGAGATVKVTCDVIIEKEFALASSNVMMPGLKLSNSDTSRFGIPSPSGAAIVNGMVTVSGPKNSVLNIDHVYAEINEEKTLDTTASFAAELIAYDAYDRPVEGVSFLNAEEGTINVVVPVLQHYQETLTPTVKNAPEGLADKVTVTPGTIELWVIPTEVEEYLTEVRNHLTVDFQQVLAEGKVISLPLELKKTGSILPLSNSEKVELKIDVSSCTNKKFSVPLNDETVEILNCPDGYEVAFEQTVLPNVVVCGNNSVLKKLKADQMKIVLDLDGLSAGHNTVKVSVQCADPTAWIYYGETGYEVQINIVKK